MNQPLITAIAEGNFSAILSITSQLTDSERYETIAAIKVLDPYSEKDFPRKNVAQKDTYYHNHLVSQAFYYALITMVREESDMPKVIMDRKGYQGYPYKVTPYVILASYYFEPVINYFTQFPPDNYIKKVLKERYNKEIDGLSFGFQWYFYKKGWIPFEEERFVKNLLEINMGSRSVTADAQFLFQYPEAIEKVLLQLYRIETKVLDLSKWKSDNPSSKMSTSGVAKVTTYWDEVFELLVHYGYQIPRSFVGQLLESLLNQWKKPHLDWHCRLLKWLAPTQEELLAHQQTLFAVLGTGVGSVVKTVMEYIVSIANAPQFDFESFMQQFPLAFTVEKQPKTLLQGVEILAKEFKKHPPTDVSYREQLAVLFTVPDAKLQEKVANLLTTYFNQEGLPEVIAPYCDYLKGKAQDLLATLSPSESSAPSDLSDRSASSENSENSENSHSSHSSHPQKTARTLTPVSCPLTPENLLFLLGDCIREGTAATIDLFFEGLVQLQDQLPENFKEQLAPYIKQLGGYSVSGQQVRAMLLLLRGWAEDKAIETPPKEWEPYIKKARELGMSEDKKDQQESAWLWCVFSTHKELLYFFNKIKTTISKLKNGDRLPFLATPSVKPFYIDADTLANRLLIYQTAGKGPELDDIVVAANRLLSSTITPEAKDKVRTLTGKYARAMAYLFELTDEITPEEEILPLWTQMTRIKHPNAIFEEFKNTSAYDYPAVVKPFYIHSYTIDDYRFHLENDYNYYGFKKEKALPYNFYNAGNYDKLHSSTFKYFMSLNPQYLDALLCRYVPYWVRISDATTYEDLNQITTFLLVNDLRIYHSGWLFMGIAFLHDKKETRDLATEYILCAISRDEDLSYLQHFLADILAQKLTPINRFVEFLDMPTRNKKVKEFQKGVVEEYLRLVENVEKKPTNHKKLVAFIN